jgi:hypothetical protein
VQVSRNLVESLDGRRETSSPSAPFAGQGFVEAVVDRDNENPRFMIRDRDSIYGKEFLGIGIDALVVHASGLRDGPGSPFPATCGHHASARLYGKT